MQKIFLRYFVLHHMIRYLMYILPCIRTFKSLPFKSSISLQLLFSQSSFVFLHFVLIILCTVSYSSLCLLSSLLFPSDLIFLQSSISVLPFLFIFGIIFCAVLLIHSLRLSHCVSILSNPCNASNLFLTSAEYSLLNSGSMLSIA